MEYEEMNELEKIVNYSWSSNVPEKNYEELLFLLNTADYSKKLISIKRDEIELYFPSGKVLLEHKFPISKIYLANNTSSQPLKFSDDESKDYQIKVKLLRLITS